MRGYSCRYTSMCGICKKGEGRGVGVEGGTAMGVRGRGVEVECGIGAVTLPYPAQTSNPAFDLLSVPTKSTS